MSRIMTHVVAGYPTYKKCISLLQAMQSVGVKMIEVQIPFSDPIADGETIMRANDKAIELGMTTKKSFEMIKKANLSADVYIMSYFQKVLAYDEKKFCQDSTLAGAKGLIIPDLPFDAPEYEKLRLLSRIYKLHIIPVISPGIDDKRLEAIVGDSDDLIYLTSTKGITGSQVSYHSELDNIAKKIKQLKPNIQLAIGFGIASKDDVEEISKIADMAIVGSSLIRELNSKGIDKAINFLQSLNTP